jgi:hydroxyethylthiazole kinase-like uncharacterized protein yjeF
MNSPENGLRLYSTSTIRACEKMAMDAMGWSEDFLMEKAGLAAFLAIESRFSSLHHWAIFCGSGNNAGDGYIVARLAQEAGHDVTVYQYQSLSHLPPTARQAASLAIAAGLVCHSLEDLLMSDLEFEADLLIDALFGIGLSRPIEGDLALMIEWMNRRELPLIALDIPSGLEANTGQILGIAIQATLTVTFIGRKTGMMTLNGPDCCGEIIDASIDLEPFLAQCSSKAMVYDGEADYAAWPRRLRNSHKGDFGHVLMIGGGVGMPGALAMAAKAAYRIGAGLVTVALHPMYAHQPLADCSEAMIYGVASAEALAPLLERASVCLIGPGLGVDAWALSLYQAAISAQLPMVIDASALRLLADDPQHDDGWILTPHPGEAGVLLGTDSSTVQANRYEAVQQLQAQYGGTIILKGIGSLIATDEAHLSLMTTGNPGMATAGMGDVLSGIIVGLLAQGFSSREASKLGAWLHGRAGDAASTVFGERGLMATDLMNYLV